jgi:hypothetical protein
MMRKEGGLGAFIKLGYAFLFKSESSLQGIPLILVRTLPSLIGKGIRR